MNPEFEEWLEEMLSNFFADSDDDREIAEMIARDAYKLGLNRGFGCVMDKTLMEEVNQELQVLNKDD